MGTRSFRCVSPTNIAVIKYWGKRDRDLLLPVNSSISLTIDPDDLCTDTTVKIDLDSSISNFNFTLNNSRVELCHVPMLVRLVDKFREERKKLETLDGKLEKISCCHLEIDSVNNFPTASGLASSASGYAAVTYCLAHAFGLDHISKDMSKLSQFARLGSGSACRSFFGGFVIWNAGTHPDGSDSFATQICPGFSWNLSIVIIVVDSKEKKIPSTEGMAMTVATSDFLPRRREIVDERINLMKKAISERDFDSFAEITMRDSNQFHALCQDTYPPLRYMNSTSHEIVRLVNEYNSKTLYGENYLGKKGYKAAYTFDAGPNAVLFCRDYDVHDLLSIIASRFNPNGPECPLDKHSLKDFIQGRVKYEELKQVDVDRSSLCNPVEKIIVSRLSERGAQIV